MTTGRALVIGDVYTLSRDQEHFLTSSGMEITHVSADNMPSVVLNETFDVAIAGVTYSGPDLSAAVRELFRIDPELPIILIADDLRLRDAYALGQNLAYDCVPRVVENGWLLHKLKLAVMQRQLLLENRALSIGTPDSKDGTDDAEIHFTVMDLTGGEDSGELYKASEKKVILEALSKTRWNRRKAARLLGISYNTLRRRIDSYHLNSSSS